MGINAKYGKFNAFTTSRLLPISAGSTRGCVGMHRGKGKSDYLWELVQNMVNLMPSPHQSGCRSQQGQREAVWECTGEKGKSDFLWELVQNMVNLMPSPHQSGCRSQQGQREAVWECTGEKGKSDCLWELVQNMVNLMPSPHQSGCRSQQGQREAVWECTGIKGESNSSGISVTNAKFDAFTTSRWLPISAGSARGCVG